ncbi:hypothetical protein HK105_208463 [Polyrhizophydium stewartii]|uniref:Uncharacterized protein n=1 Tax=Polyrhizophydium stewartii TaxID=2732419 RepID=A0ABR4MXT9_9FUNG
MAVRRTLFLLIVAFCVANLVFLALLVWSPNVYEAVNLVTGMNTKMQLADLEVLSRARTVSQTRIVASMSTFPARMDRVRLSLASLFNQTLPLDAVHVNIPDRIRRMDAPINETELAADLADLRDKFGPRLQIHRGEDYGPATKLIGSLPFETDPDTLIITVDDDVEYDPRTVQVLYQGYREHPSNFVAAACEELITLANYNWIYINDNRVCNGWACAYKGVLYRVGMFDKTIFDYSDVPKGCVVHDDVYLSGFLLRKGYRPFHIGLDFNTVVVHHSHAKYTVHGTAGVKEHQVECLKYFDLFKG